MTEPVLVVRYDELYGSEVPPRPRVVPRDAAEILALGEFGGRTVDEWNRILSASGPGAASMDGYQGPDDNVLVTMARDADVLAELNVDMETVTRATRVLAHRFRTTDLPNQFVAELVPGEFYLVSEGSALQSHTSIVDGAGVAARDMTVHHFRTGVEVTLTAEHANTAEAFGFCQGPGSMWRIAPEDLVRLYCLRSEDEIQRAVREVDERYDFDRYRQLAWQRRHGVPDPYSGDPLPIAPISRSTDVDLNELRKLEILGMDRVPGTDMVHAGPFMVDCGERGGRPYWDVASYLESIGYPGGRAVKALQVVANPAGTRGHEVRIRLLGPDDTLQEVFPGPGGVVHGGLDRDQLEDLQLAALGDLPIERQLELGGFQRTDEASNQTHVYRRETENGAHVALVDSGTLTALYASTDDELGMHPWFRDSTIVGVQREQRDERGRIIEHAALCRRSGSLRFWQVGPFRIDSIEQTHVPTRAEVDELTSKAPRSARQFGLDRMVVRDEPPAPVADEPPARLVKVERPTPKGGGDGGDMTIQTPTGTEPGTFDRPGFTIE